MLLLEQPEGLFVADSNTNSKAIVENRSAFLRKLNMNLPYNPAVPLVGKKNEKISIQKNLYIFVYVGLIHNLRKLQTHQMSLCGEWAYT